MAATNTTLTATFQLVDEMSDRLSDIAENGTRAADSFSEIGDAAENTETVATQSATQTAKSVDDVGDSFEDAGKKADSSGSTMTDAINTVASALSAAGIVAMVSEVTGALLECSDVAATFETAMLKVSTVADTSEVPLDELTAGIKNLSMETGKSTSELSDAMYQALSASVDTADAIDFTATAVQLAAGGFTETATAVDALTTILNAYGLEASEAANISDILITTQNLGKTTVDELASGLGRVIPTASAYNVSMEQIGASYAELTKNGLSTRISTTYLNSMLSELGDSGSTVAEILRDETGMSLSQLMDTGYSLGDVLNILGDSVDGDTAAFNELWSSSTAGMAALTMYNAGVEEFNDVLGEMQDSAGATATAYDTMTDSTQHAKEELANAASNLQESIGSAINPAMEMLYEAGTGVLNTFTTFADEHPIVVKALTAIAVGIGAVVTVVTAVSVVIPLVTKAVTALGTAFNTALGPIGWVAMAIGAVATAGVAFVAMLNDSSAEYQTWTASTKSQYDALQDLNAQYAEACEVYGETSEQASRLRYQIDDATEAFENSKMTIEEYTAEVDTLCDSIAELVGGYQDSLANIDSNEKGAMALIQKYADLATQTDLTAAEQKQLDAVTKSLSESYPDIIESLDKAGASAEEYVVALRNAAEAEAEEQRLAEAQDAYVEALQKRAELTEEIEKTEAELADEQARMDSMSWWEHLWTTNEWDGLDAYSESLDKLNAAQAENEALILNIESGWADLAREEEEAAGSASSYEEAVSIAFDSVEDRIMDLCEAYDNAYQAALESFSGQYGLFDEAQADMDATVEAAQAALESQLAYWDNYLANIDALKATSAEDLGITQENYDMLMAYVQDGSEEAAGLAASMVENINSGNTEAVAELANTIADVSQRQEEAAAATADWQTNFTEQMTDYADEMCQIVTEDLDLSEEAATAATDTINAYVEQILEGKTAAVSAAEEVAQAVSSALSSANATINVTTATSTRGYARGTTNAASVFVAGENGPELVVPAHAGGTMEGEPYYLAGESGPELIVGQEGSTVFPASETNRLINALSYGQRTQGGSETMKRIVLEIAGSGEIDVSGGANMDAVLELLEDNLKPVLLKILQQEVLEEGDLSYEF